MTGLLTQRLFAHRCPLCRVPETDGGLCRRCLDALPALGPHCRICCEPLAVPAPACARCLGDPPCYERVLTPCRYAPVADRLIREFKYGRRLERSVPIGKLLARHVRSAGGTLPCCLVPVPLHHERIRQRGFNQSLEIARVLAAELGVELDAACVEKTRRTVPQTALGAKRRRRNLKGAFHLRRRPRAQSVAIVDDVMTTGATAGEMAKVLARAGVAHIEVWVAARAVA